MQIVYFHQYFSTPSGSSGMRSYEFARAAIAKGHQVTMVCGSYSGSDTGLSGIPFIHGKRCGIVNGIKVLEFSLPYSNETSFTMRILLFVKYAMRCTWYALFVHYDLLFATSTPLTVGIPGIIMKLFRKTPFIFEVRDLWPELPKAMKVITNPFALWAIGLLEKMSYRAADQCIGLSPGIIKGITCQGVPSEKVHLIPNGCDLEIFKPIQTKDRSVFPVQPNNFIALFTGTHGIANGLEAVLNAGVELIKFGRNDIKLVMIGEGKLKPILREKALKENIHNCIFMDAVPKTRVAHITASSDIGLMILADVAAFYYGTSPNKFFDYIACGLPVLNNYPGWLAEMITEHSCGIVVPPSDPTAFANALIYLADNRDIVIQMSENAKTLSNRFNRKKFAEQFVALAESAFTV